MTANFDIIEAKRSGFYLGGGKGSGKTKAAQLFADALMEAGITVYVFDNSQAWQTGSSIPKHISVSKLPLILDFPSDQSTIFDMSTLYVEEQKMVVANICKALFTRQVSLPKEKRKWIFLIFEEAQIYLQQGSMRSKSASEVMRLITVGRNFCIGFGLVTQYPSTVDKLLIKAIRQRYFGYTDEKNDKDYIESFLGKKLVEELKTMKAGEFMFNCGGITKRVQFPLFISPIVPEKCDCTKQVQSSTSLTIKNDEHSDLKTTMTIIFVIAAIIFAVYVFTHTTNRYVQSVALPLWNLLT